MYFKGMLEFPFRKEMGACCYPFTQPHSGNEGHYGHLPPGEVQSGVSSPDLGAFTPQMCLAGVSGLHQADPYSRR